MTIKVTIQPPKLVQGRETELLITLHNKDPAPCTNIVVGFRLPLQIVLVKGARRLRIPRLNGGASWQHRPPRGSSQSRGFLSPPGARHLGDSVERRLLVLASQRRHHPHRL